MRGEGIFNSQFSILNSSLYFLFALAVDLLARLVHQLIEPRVDDLLPLSHLILTQGAAAVLQLHRHIPALLQRETIELLLPILGPALDEALKRPQQDVRAIGIERRQREPVVVIVGAVGLFR